VETPRLPVSKPLSRGIPSTMPLHEHYTFENFVRGPSNSFAHAAATAVAKGPGRTSYNPLFIYGGTGLGKTHLMEAIGHYVLQTSPHSSVCFITSETFLNEYVNALTNDALPAFRERYRKVDVLLLDDVQFIADKEKIQEEFFNTFNSLMLYHKQVVITSDVAPKNLKGCEERLTGRFQQGMVVEIESPSYETRLAILKSKAQSTQKIIPEEILKYIAENIRSHVRAIEGALARIVTFMDLNSDIPLSIEIAQHLLKDSIEEEKTFKDLSINDIMQTVASFYGVTLADILSTQRTQTLVTPRQLAMFLARKLTTKSLPEIAKAFGKTHATVLHGTQTIQKRIDVESDLKKSMGEIASLLGRKASDVLE
jgi:chromosomal replication initiator protein